MFKPGRRETICRIVKGTESQRLPYRRHRYAESQRTEYPDLAEYEKSIDVFAACGVKVMITELDLNMLPSPKTIRRCRYQSEICFRQDDEPLPQRVGQSWTESVRRPILGILQHLQSPPFTDQPHHIMGRDRRFFMAQQLAYQGRTNYPRSSTATIRQNQW